MTTTSTTTDDDERPVALSEPVTDPFTTLPDLTPLRDAAQAGDWQATQAFFTTLDSTENPVENPVENSVEKMSFAAGQLAGLDGVETYLEQAAADHPADPLPAPSSPSATSASAGPSAAAPARSACRATSSPSSTTGWGGPSAC